MSDASAPSAPLIDVAPLAAALATFTSEREWGEFHSPKNLVMALGGEVGELTEIFQWMTEAQSRDAGRAPATAQAVHDELADVLMYLVHIASALGVDLNHAVQQKLARNAVKYPVDKARGSSKKYNEL